jgi:hypothetical protein
MYDTQSTSGTPQCFVGDPEPDTPEPGSFLLLGIGLLGLAVFWFRRRNVTS